MLVSFTLSAEGRAYAIQAFINYSIFISFFAFLKPAVVPRAMENRLVNNAIPIPCLSAIYFIDEIHIFFLVLVLVLYSYFFLSLHFFLNLFSFFFQASLTKQ